MRLIALDQITGAEILARPIFDIDGRKLLNAGSSLKPNIIQKLYEKGLTSVYIDDELSEGIEIDTLLKDETSLKAKAVIREEMNRLSQKKEVNVANFSAVVDMIMDEILSRRISLINVKDLRLHDERTFAHSLSVCVMAIALSTKLGLPLQKIKGIAMGAIMHDMGKALIPPALLKKDGDLSQSEMNEYKKHAVMGYNAVKDYLDVSATTKIAILMHHEHINGSGYPMGLAGDKIHYSARIVTICDAFDTTINDIKSKSLYRTTDAVEYLIGASGHVFDKSFVDEFIRIIPIYIEGTLVLLSNGIVAIVIKNNPVHMTRPIVRAVYHPKTKTKYGKNYIIDLQEDLSIKILREINLSLGEMNNP